MFDMTRDPELKQEYEDKIHQTAEANLFKKTKQPKGNQPSILTRLLYLLRRPHDRMKHELASK